MRSRGRIAALAALLVLSSVATVHAVDRSGLPTAGTRVLRGLSSFNLDDTISFTDAVTDLSEGTITLDLEQSAGSNEPDGEEQIIEAVRSGATDIGLIGSRAIHATGVNSFDALQAPFVITSYETEADVLRSPIVDEMAAGLAGSGLTAVAVLPGALRYIFSIDEPMVEPADFTGKTVMMTRSPVSTQIFTALGATTVDQWSPEADQGYDATELPLTATLGNAADARYVLANVVFEPRPIVVLMSDAGAAVLSDAERTVLHDAAHGSVDAAIDRLVRDDGENVANACRSGMTLLNASSGQQEALAAAEQPVIDQLAASGPWLGEIRSLLGSAQPAQAIDCQSVTTTAQPSVAASPLDGTWKACFTAQQILDAGGDPGEAQANAGCYSMSFHAGVFTDSVDPHPGRYEIDGNQLTIDQPNGERFVFTWVLLGDQLSLGRGPAGSISPAPLLAVPFERVGD